MDARKAERLLGGYAAGTLSQEERQALFEAALQDQGLFEALADEEALKELLDDPSIRRRLLAALTASNSAAGGGAHQTWLGWLRRRAVLAYVGSLAAVIIAIVITLPRAPWVPPAGEMVARSDRLEEPAPQAPSPSRAARKTAREDEGRSGKGEPAPATSFAPRPEPGPARALFYGRAASVLRAEEPAGPRDRRGKRPEQGRLGQAREELEQRSATSSQSAVEEKARPARPLGLRYSVLERGVGGAFHEADPSGPFRPNEALRVTVEGNAPGFLYVLQQGPEGDWTWAAATAAPPPDGRGRAIPAQPGIRYRVPTEGAFSLAEGTAPHRLLVVFSRRPLSGLRAEPPGGAGQRGVPPPLASDDVARFVESAGVQGAGRPLLLEQVRPAPESGAGEHAVYVVRAPQDHDVPVVLEITLPIAP